MTNPELAALFDELADIMEIAGEDRFKIHAYRNASIEIKAHRESISDLPLDKLQQLSGIGKAISGKIHEAGETGTFAALEKWRQSGYASLRPILGVKGLSIGKLRNLLKDLNINSKTDLIDSIKDGRFEGYREIDAKVKEGIIHLITG